MYWKRYFIPTSRENPAGSEATSHALLLRSGLVNMLTSGVYSYLPLGLRVLRRVETIIREEMDRAGAHELFLPVLQPLELWQKTGRDAVMNDIMIRFKDQKGRQMVLGPTHEEVITHLVRHYVQSYRQLPVTLYQIQTKFRDELRTRFGIVRACEFIMKDAYSFDRDIAGLKENYQRMYEAYVNIFNRCALDVVIVSADSGAMGGDVSHEYLVPAAIGEDAIARCGACGYAGGWKEAYSSDQACPECGQPGLKRDVAIELGHIFQLGTKYSQALEAVFLDEEGQQKPIIMGCYGIGVSRLIAAILECHHDDKGIIWPREVAPFDIEILPLQAADEQTARLTVQLHDELESCGWQVLVDDRDESAGVKFNDADLIGIPYRVVLGKKALVQGELEIKERRTGEVKRIPLDGAVEHIRTMLQSEGRPKAT